MPKMNIMNRNIIIELYDDAFRMFFFKLLGINCPPNIAFIKLLV